MKVSQKNLWLGVLLVLAFWLTRLLAIGVFPPFLDEAVHIHFGEISRQTSLFAFAAEGRLFTIWWYMLFQSHLAGGVWLVRMVTVLAVLPGFAAGIGIGRRAAGVWGGLLAGLIYLFSTYHLFYERLALSDSISGAAITLGLYFAFRLSRRANLWDAILAGIMIFAAIGFKIAALPYLGIPLAAVITLRPKGSNDRHWRWLVAALTTGVGLTGIFALGLRVLDYDLFYLIGMHNPNAGQGILARSIENAGNMLAGLSAYTGTAVFLLLLASVIILILRRHFYLPLCLLAPLVILWVSERQSTRFYIAPMTILLLCGAVVLADAIRQRRVSARLGLVLVLAWGLVQWLPFAWIASHDPLSLNLAAADQSEYVLSDASGFGLAEVYRVLTDQQPRQVFGLLSNCQSLRYMALGRFTVTCPRVNPDGSDVAALATLIAQNRAEGIYVVLEDSAYVPAEASGRLVTTIEDGRPRLSIYDLAPQGFCLKGILERGGSLR